MSLVNNRTQDSVRASKLSWDHAAPITVINSIINIKVNYKKSASHRRVILLGYPGLIQQRIE
ncbi:MAG: hypothetical protein [Olavius algarvensis Gamma 3 endosymbiont]|nr:MAG: hypothetical protein [Olavius algarvensis Gamma 3 endosymbiont]